jgi:anaerobic selenocysteine-containing dehydrogenase
MYDDSVTVRNTEILRPLAPPALARLHPRDASALAVEDGDLVQVAGVELPVAVDSQVVPGSVVLPFNQVATRGMPASAAVSIQAVRGDA